MMALEGLLIIDMTIWQHGPVSTAMLADMGAEVIKVEERVSGDPGRYLSTWNFGKNSGADLNYYFENNNRNKKSLALDLKTPEGKEVMIRLIKKADAFVSNFREPSLKRLGFDYESVHAINPKLVYSAGYGFGPKGPDSARPSAGPGGAGPGRNHEPDPDLGADAGVGRHGRPDRGIHAVPGHYYGSAYSGANGHRAEGRGIVVRYAAGSGGIDGPGNTVHRESARRIQASGP